MVQLFVAETVSINVVVVVADNEMSTAVAHAAAAQFNSLSAVMEKTASIMNNLTYLQTNNNFLLYKIRRIGKSSFFVFGLIIALCNI